MGEIDLQCPFCGKGLKATDFGVICDNNKCMYNELHKAGFDYVDIMLLSEYPPYIIDGVKRLYLTGKLEKTLKLLEELQLESV